MSQGAPNMEDHETRRKIIREWMALPKDKRHTEEQVVTFAKKAIQKNEFHRSRRDPRPSISARPVPEDYGMALASRWEVVIGRSAKIFGSSSCRAFGFFRTAG
jgi:hypothetical protein